MANTTLTQSGAQVQADLNKVEGMAEIKTVGSGLTLSSAGELSASGGVSIGGGYTFTFDSDMASACEVFVLCGKITSTTNPTEDYFGLHALSNYGIHTCENAVLFFTDSSSSDFSLSVNNCRDATGSKPSTITAYKVYFLNGNTTLLYRD